MSLKLSIKNKNPGKTAYTARDLEVALNGVPIERGLHELVLRISSDGINEADIRLTPSEIEVDADVVALLQANIKPEGAHG